MRYICFVLILLILLLLHKKFKIFQRIGTIMAWNCWPISMKNKPDVESASTYTTQNMDIWNSNQQLNAVSVRQPVNNQQLQTRKKNFSAKRTKWYSNPFKNLSNKPRSTTRTGQEKTSSLLQLLQAPPGSIRKLPCQPTHTVPTKHLQDGYKQTTSLAENINNLIQIKQEKTPYLFSNSIKNKPRQTTVNKSDNTDSTLPKSTPLNVKPFNLEDSLSNKVKSPFPYNYSDPNKTNFNNSSGSSYSYETSFKREISTTIQPKTHQIPKSISNQINKTHNIDPYQKNANPQEPHSQCLKTKALVHQKCAAQGVNKNFSEHNPLQNEISKPLESGTTKYEFQEFPGNQSHKPDIATRENSNYLARPQSPITENKFKVSSGIQSSGNYSAEHNLPQKELRNPLKPPFEVEPEIQKSAQTLADKDNKSHLFSHESNRSINHSVGHNPSQDYPWNLPESGTENHFTPDFADQRGTQKLAREAYLSNSEGRDSNKSITYLAEYNSLQKEILKPMESVTIEHQYKGQGDEVFEIQGTAPKVESSQKCNKNIVYSKKKNQLEKEYCDSLESSTTKTQFRDFMKKTGVDKHKDKEKLVTDKDPQHTSNVWSNVTRAIPKEITRDEKDKLNKDLSLSEHNNSDIHDDNLNDDQKFARQQLALESLNAGHRLESYDIVCRPEGPSNNANDIFPRQIGTSKTKYQDTSEPTLTRLSDLNQFRYSPTSYLQKQTLGLETKGPTEKDVKQTSDSHYLTHQACEQDDSILENQELEKEPNMQYENITSSQKNLTNDFNDVDNNTSSKRLRDHTSEEPSYQATNITDMQDQKDSSLTFNSHLSYNVAHENNKLGDTNDNLTKLVLSLERQNYQNKAENVLLENDININDATKELHVTENFFTENLDQDLNNAPRDLLYNKNLQQENSTIYEPPDIDVTSTFDSFKKIETQCTIKPEERKILERNVSEDYTDTRDDVEKLNVVENDIKNQPSQDQLNMSNVGLSQNATQKYRAEDNQNKTNSFENNKILPIESKIEDAYQDTFQSNHTNYSDKERQAIDRSYVYTDTSHRNFRSLQENHLVTKYEDEYLKILRLKTSNLSNSQNKEYNTSQDIFLKETKKITAEEIENETKDVLQLGEAPPLDENIEKYMEVENDLNVIEIQATEEKEIKTLDAQADAAELVTHLRQEQVSEQADKSTERYESEIIDPTLYKSVTTKLAEIRKKAEPFVDEIKNFKELADSNKYYYIEESLRRLIDKLDDMYDEIDEYQLLRDKRKEVYKFIFPLFDRLDEREEENRTKMELDS